MNLAKKENREKYKDEFLKRLKKTEQEGVYQDPATGTLIIRSTKKEQMLSETVKRVTKLELDVTKMSSNIEQILQILTTTKD